MRRGFGQRALIVRVPVLTSCHHQRCRPGCPFPPVGHQQARWAWPLGVQVEEGHQRASFRTLVDIRSRGLPREFVVRGANVLRAGHSVDDCIHGAAVLVVLVLLWARLDYQLADQKAKAGDWGSFQSGRRRLGRRVYLPEQAQPVNREPSALYEQIVSVCPTWWPKVEAGSLLRR